MRNIHVLIICITILVTNSFAQNTDISCYHNIDCNEFNYMIETTDVLIIDTRLHKEYRNERIHNAFLASTRESLVYLLKNINQDMNILVYCSKGSRSAAASQIICNDLNFNNVYNLDQGLKSWKEKGYPIDKSKLKEKQLNN